MKLWSLLPLSLAGRIAILKMLVLPKLLYLFANIPVPFTRAFFHKIRSTALSLIWAGVIPRITWSLLVRPMSKGGLRAPDFELYTLCAQAQYLQYWIHPIPFQPHVATEADVAEPIPLNMAVYYPYHRTPHKINTVEMVRWAWDGLRRRAQVPLLYAPSIPISRDPSFPFLHDKEAIDRAQAIGIGEDGGSLPRGDFIPGPTEQDDCGLPILVRLLYHQIKSVCRAMNSLPGSPCYATCPSEPAQHTISPQIGLTTLYYNSKHHTNGGPYCTISMVTRPGGGTD